MLDEIRLYLNNIQREYDLYVSLTKNYPQSFLNNIKKTNPKTEIIFVENKGMDIGGFLQVYKNLDPSYDLILKIHTKKGLGSTKTPSLHLQRHGDQSAEERGRKWFHGLMRGVLNNPNHVNEVIRKFEEDQNCGMIGAKYNTNFHVNLTQMQKVFSWMKVQTDLKGHQFVGGTIFWVRNDILKKYLTQSVINKILANSPEGYVHEPSINHAMERIFGSLVSLENKKLIVL
jgi:lipopolysaccharide biosynthesis protein